MDIRYCGSIFFSSHRISRHFCDRPFPLIHPLSRRCVGRTAARTLAGNTPQRACATGRSASCGNCAGFAVSTGGDQARSDNPEIRQCRSAHQAHQSRDSTGDVAVASFPPLRGCTAAALAYHAKKSGFGPRTGHVAGAARMRCSARS